MRNPYRIEGETVYIQMGIKSQHPSETIISLDDLSRLLDFDCSIYRENNYARIEFLPTSYNRRIALHRFIMGDPEGLQVDHINRDKLDNRRSNLRLVTNAQNMQNQGTRTNSASGYRGVQKRGDKWIGRVIINGKSHHVGTYNTPEETAVAVANFRALHMPYSSDAIEIEDPSLDIPVRAPGLENKTSGVLGIYFNSWKQRYCIHLVWQGRHHYGRTFKTLEEAKDALPAFKEKVGYKDKDYSS